MYRYHYTPTCNNQKDENIQYGPPILEINRHIDHMPTGTQRQIQSQICKNDDWAPDHIFWDEHIFIPRSFDDHQYKRWCLERILYIDQVPLCLGRDWLPLVVYLAVWEPNNWGSTLLPDASCVKPEEDHRWHRKRKDVATPGVFVEDLMPRSPHQNT